MTGPEHERMMPVKSHVEKSCLVLSPEGRIDAANAREFERDAMEELERHPGLEPVLDLEEVSYISSSGLRAVLNLSKSLTHPMQVRSVSPEVYDIFRMTGFTSILDVRRKLRILSVEGCEVIGRGAVGTVYRIDEDTIVKVYGAGEESLPMIENEQTRAKQALIKGIPTAISYDVVRVGENYGSVFELVQARTFNDLVIREPEKAEEVIRRYAELIGRIHAVRMEQGEVPDARETYGDYLEQLAGVLPQALRDRIGALLKEMPEDLRAVHGDLQMKNVMMSAGEPLLIDMETLCAGDPVFDFAGLFVTYRAYGEDDPANSMEFLGIDNDIAGRIFRRTLEICLGEPGEVQYKEAENKIRLLGYIRFLYLVAVLGIGKEEKRPVQIRRALEQLEELAGQVRELAL